MTGVVPTLALLTHSPGETQGLAARLALRLEPGDVIWLSGELGAGKTTFTQGLGRGLDIAVPINSPTFVLIREYMGRLPLYHIDLYRLNDAPLPREQGGPVRFLIRDPAQCHTSELDDCANVKYLDRIELSVRKGRDTRPADEAAHRLLHKAQQGEI